MSEKHENPPAVQEAIDEIGRTRDKYGHPQPDTHERDKDAPTLGFVRWVQKGGHLDPAAEDQHPEYLALFKKLGGEDDGVTLKDGTRIERTRKGEVPPANREHPTTDPQNAEIQDGAKVIVEPGEYRDVTDPGTPEAREKDDKPQPQGLTKSSLPKTSKTAKTTANKEQ